MGRPPFSAEVVRVFWAGVRAGLLVDDAGAAAGVSRPTAWRLFRAAGGVMPSAVTPLVQAPLVRAPLVQAREERDGIDAGGVGARRVGRLDAGEREEIAFLDAAGKGVNEIARLLGRDKATISRELSRNRSSDGRYRPSVAQQHTDQRARGSGRTAKLATNPALRAEVEARLELNHSPEQIARRLREDFPDDPEMWVSHETIYQSIYIQSRGALNRELARHLRTARQARKPRKQAQTRRARLGIGALSNTVNISERPPEVADRAVPGHWEGDLITGALNKTAIGTLVERTTGYLVLLHLPENHGALAVQRALIEAMAVLPETLRKTLTWDRGSEMANHIQIAAATGLDVYFCDPHSPWQRPSNENTNGLLRQYFPKGTDLSIHGPGILEAVAIEMNNRPRKRLNWATPAEALDQLLSPDNNHGVAHEH